MHHTIIAVDVAGFGTRGAWPQQKIREALLSAMRETLDHCGIAWKDCHAEDRGDGLYLLAPPNVQNKRLAECLPKELAARLHEHNVTADPAARIRLRVVLHAGEIDPDQQGQSGKAAVLAFRLLNSDALRMRLAGSRGDVAVLASAAYFHDVIENYPAAYPEHYRPVTVIEKETTETAWVFLPDDHIPVDSRKGRHRQPPVGRRPDRTFTRWARPSPPLAVLLVVLLTGGQASDVLAAVPLDRQCAEPVQLNVNVSAEKAAIIHKLVPSFVEGTRRQVGERNCKTVNVQVTTAKRSEEVIAAFGRGWSGPNDLRQVGAEPFVWLPDSAWEVEAAQKEMRAETNTNVSLVNLGSIAQSPLVIVSSRPTTGTEADATQPNDWSEVLASAQRTGRSAGQKVEYSRPSPLSSGTGMLATSVLYHARLGQPLDGRTFTRPETPRLLHDVERSIPTSDGQSDSIPCLAREQPGEVDLAMLMSEKAALDYRAGDIPGARCANDRPAAAPHVTYPRDGTLYLDHPFVMVNWNDRPVNERRQRAVRDFFDFLVGRDAQREFRLARFRDRTRTIGAVEGALPGRPVDLPIGPVDVNALLQAYEDARKSARVLFLFDVSRSMSQTPQDIGITRLQAGRNGVHEILGIGGKDKFGLWAFAERLDGHRDHRELVPMSEPERTKAALTGLVDSDRPPRLVPTLREAVASFSASDRDADVRDAIVVIAEGTSWEPDTLQLVDQLRAKPVPVFMIAFGANVCASSAWREIDRSSGGTCTQVSNSAEVGVALDGVAANLWGGGRG